MSDYHLYAHVDPSIGFTNKLEWAVDDDICKSCAEIRNWILHMTLRLRFCAVTAAADEKINFALK